MSTLRLRSSSLAFVVATMAMFAPLAKSAHADDACPGDACVPQLEPFLDPLPVPKVATPITGTAGGAATYKMSIVEIDQKLHSSLPPTRVWGLTDGTNTGTYPGPTIEASTDQLALVTWRNELRDKTTGAYRTQHYLPVDTCLTHGLGAAARTVIHLHGAHVPAAFDGYPDWTQAPGEEVDYQYPNHQEAATLWYHDHAMGTTRLGVYMGIAGFYLLRSPSEKALGFPSGEYEIPLAIQDRAFNANGTLSYPDKWVEHFEGDKMLVNGKVWPYLDVKKGKYRFRLLNGCNARVLTLTLSDGSSFQQIGSDGGLLPAPVSMTSLTLGPSERADVIVDFSARATNDAVIMKSGAMDVMKFRVVDGAGHTGAVPATLRTLTRIPESESIKTRNLRLSRSAGSCGGGVAWLINELPWETVTENVKLDSTEIWQFQNQSALAHPMHIHLVEFQVLDRTLASGVTVPPAANEAGWKDTVMVNAYENVRVIARFADYAGRFTYHCHLLEHEDNMMMRQFEVIDPDAGPVDVGVKTDASHAGDAHGADAHEDSAVSDGATTDAGHAGHDSSIATDATVGDSGAAIDEAPAEDEGCGCRVPRSSSPRSAGGAAIAVLGAMTWLRRRQRAA